MQVEAANVQGRNLILETLSQYSALMVLKHNFSQTKVDQFLTLQQEEHDTGQKKSEIVEVPLYLVEDDDHLYHNKGAIVMYKLQELIGEDSVNFTLQSFIVDWNTQTGRVKKNVDRYPISRDLLSYILGCTPIDLRTEVLKLFTEV